jgi:hypothetical protein
MRYRRVLTGSLVLVMCCVLAAGKDKKKKILLPADVLQAKTVLVLIDPDAGVSPEDPNANQVAREDVERALMKWGRFELATDVSTADLVISVRKGNGRVAQTTIGGLGTNNRPVVADSTDSEARIGANRGSPAPAGDPTGAEIPRPSPQTEVGAAQDVFAVYRGKRHGALDAPAIWRYSEKDALRSPAVPAVDAFRKLIADAEKQQASKP